MQPSLSHVPKGCESCVKGGAVQGAGAPLAVMSLAGSYFWEVTHQRWLGKCGSHPCDWRFHSAQENMDVTMDAERTQQNPH